MLKKISALGVIRMVSSLWGLSDMRKMTGDRRPETGKNDREPTRAFGAGVLSKQETEKCPRRDSNNIPPVGTKQPGIKKKKCPRRDSNGIPPVGTKQPGL